MDSFVGEIRIFAFPYAPMDWALCDGSLIPVNQSQALYSILGNRYGGTPNVTFGLPDLRCRAGLGATTALPAGAVNGCDAVGLSIDQLGPHTHALNAHGAATLANETAGPTANASFVSRQQTPAAGTTPVQVMRSYCKPATGVPDCALAASMVGPIGSGQAHENRQPFLALNFCISLAGEYPVRP